MHTPVVLLLCILRIPNNIFIMKFCNNTQICTVPVTLLCLLHIGVILVIRNEKPDMLQVMAKKRVSQSTRYPSFLWYTIPTNANTASTRTTTASHLGTPERAVHHCGDPPAVYRGHGHPLGLCHVWLHPHLYGCSRAVCCPVVCILFKPYRSDASLADVVDDGGDGM